MTTRGRIAALAAVATIAAAAQEGISMGESTATGALGRVIALDTTQAKLFRRAVMGSGNYEDVFILVKHADEATRQTFFEQQPAASKVRIQQLVGETDSVGPDRLAEAEKAVTGLLDGPAMELAAAALLYDEGRFEEAGRRIDAVLATGAGGRGDWYNAACAWALAGDGDAAFRDLDRAVDEGWRDRSHLESDTDLAGLHADPRWDRLVARIEATEQELLAGQPASHEPRAFIDLPAPRHDGDCSVERALSERRSVRKFGEGPLTLEQVSQLLWSAYGVTQAIPNAPGFLRGGLKTAPSAGALYPLEVYLVAGDVTGLEPGIYLYFPEGHRIGLIAEGDVRAALCTAALDQSWVREAPASLVYSAVYERTTAKYGARGRERYVCMDVGHSGENVYLQCGALGLGTCAIGAFDDVEVKRTVGMTKAEEPLYIMPVGRRKE